MKALVLILVLSFAGAPAFADDVSDCMSVENSETSVFNQYRDSLRECYAGAHDFYDLIGKYNDLCAVYCNRAAAVDPTYAQIPAACQGIKDAGDSLRNTWATHYPQCAN